MAPINRGFLTAGILTIIGTLVFALVYVGNPKGGSISNVGWRMFGAVVGGLVLAQIASRITEYFTSTETKPVQEIAESAATGGPATAVLSGVSSGLESSVWAIVAIAGALGFAIVLGAQDLQFSLYLVALTGMGMLATTGVVVSEDTFGPVADNAAGIAEMSGEFEGEPQRIMVSLDAVGNTTKAVTKGFAIGSAVIAAVALFSSYIETIKNQLEPEHHGQRALHEPAHRDQRRRPEDVHRAAHRRIDRVPVLVVRDPGGGPHGRRRRARGAAAVRRRQDHERREASRLRPVIDICTAASLRELATPALLAVLTPVIIGFGINYFALGAFLAAVILTGQLMANFLSNSGGAWDNAKKYIEDGNYGGKGSDAYRAAVIGDTIGDPFKDTAGPGAQPVDQGDEPGLVVDPARGHQPAAQLGVRFVHRGRRARRADRRDPVLEARRRDARRGRGRGTRRSRSRGREVVTARQLDAGVAGAAPAFARLCLRHSRNGGISDSTMITATIGKR